jgi:hypothetical protein
MLQSTRMQAARAHNKAAATRQLQRPPVMIDDDFIKTEL